MEVRALSSSAAPPTRAGRRVGASLAPARPAPPADHFEVTGPACRPHRLARLGLAALAVAAGAVPLLGPVGCGGAPPPAVSSTTENTARHLERMAAEGGFRPGEMEELQRSLGKLDPRVARALEQSGVRLRVVRPGDDLTTAGVLTPVDILSYSARIPDLRRLGERLHREAQRKFDQRLAELAIQRDDQPAPPGGGLLGTASKADPVAEEIQRLQAAKGRWLVEELKKADLPVKPFTFPTSPALGGWMGGTSQLLASMPVSLEGMAQVHGARTPEEKAEFFALVEAINGPRLEQARQEALQRVEARARQLLEEGQIPPGPGARNLEQYLEGLRRNPHLVPVDHRNLNLLVPDLFYHHTGDGRTLRLDEHDFTSLRNWHEAGDKVSPGQDREGRPVGVVGQYFPKTRRIIVRDSMLGESTPLHEVGHAVDHLVERADAEFYAGWRDRLQQAYDRVSRGESRSISLYSRTNLKEYLADGFALYHRDPQTLKSQDAPLYSLVEELLARAARVGVRLEDLAR
ncbi:MAG TPA: hypothetical protein VNO81_13560 [Candidatus Nitrosotenuis sp.]|nr:hypothetical protein [Candidatus Nitrosotenuis sp.]